MRTDAESQWWLPFTEKEKMENVMIASGARSSPTTKLAPRRRPATRKRTTGQL